MGTRTYPGIQGSGFLSCCGKKSGVKDEPTRDPPAKLAKPAKVGGSIRLGGLGALGEG
jgi:hypothetical protein